MSKVELVQVKSYPGNYEIARKLNKQFCAEYEHECKTKTMTRKQAIAVAKSDIEAGNLFWILVDGKRAGYCLTAIANTENNRYLDTRYIIPKFQGQGIGGKVLELCEQVANVTMARLKLSTAFKHYDYWKKRGYGAVSICGYTDLHFAPEVEHKVEDPHVWLIHDRHPHQEDYPRIDNLEAFQNAVKEAA